MIFLGGDGGGCSGGGDSRIDEEYIIDTDITCCGLGRTGLDRYAALAKVGSREKIECV